MSSRLIFLIALLTVVLSGCRTSEAHYRAAYEKAKALRGDTDGIDGTIYDAIRREAEPRLIVIGNDTIPAKRVRVKLVDAADSATVSPLYLVTGQFKQLFNARSMRDRLRHAGYPGATLLCTDEPLYYVAALATGDDAAAAAAYRQFIASPSVAVKPPFPWVLITTR